MLPALSILTDQLIVGELRSLLTVLTFGVLAGLTLRVMFRVIEDAEFYQ